MAYFVCEAFSPPFLLLRFGLCGMGAELRGEAAVGGARGGRFGLRDGLRAARVGDGLEGVGLAFGMNLHCDLLCG